MTFLFWYAACALVSVAFTTSIGRAAGVEVRHWRAAAIWPVFWAFVVWRCMQ